MNHIILKNEYFIKSECLETTKPHFKSEAKMWCRHTDSNCGPTDYKSVALPTELCRRCVVNSTEKK